MRGIIIHFSPHFDTLHIDGKEVDRFGTKNLYGNKFKGSLPIGHHTVTIHNQNCENVTFSIEVIDDKKGEPLTFHKQWNCKRKSN